MFFLEKLSFSDVMVSAMEMSQGLCWYCEADVGIILQCRYHALSCNCTNGVYIDRNMCYMGVLKPPNRKAVKEIVKRGGELV